MKNTILNRMNSSKKDIVLIKPDKVFLGVLLLELLRREAPYHPIKHHRMIPHREDKSSM